MKYVNFTLSGCIPYPLDIQTSRNVPEAPQ